MTNVVELTQPDQSVELTEKAPAEWWLIVKGGETRTIAAGETTTRAGAIIDGTLSVDGTLSLTG